MCMVVHHSHSAGGLHQRRIVEGRFERAKAGLCQPQALCDQVLEVGFGQARLENDRARVDPHPAGPVIEKAGARGQRQRFHTRGILWAAGNVHFRCGDRRGGAAVQIAFEISDHALARGVISKGDVDMAVDQAGDCGRAGRVDDNFASGYGIGRQRADRGNRSAIEQDAVA
ncbi:MAG: hypothetical protein WDN50_10675 [Bradyrhizobium sp.]